MAEPETIYTSILTATYDEEEETAETAIQYSTELPRRLPADLYPIYSLDRQLRQEYKTTAFEPYSDHPHLTIDEVFADSDIPHWMPWLEDAGYGEFVCILKDTVREEGEVYLLASKDSLPATTIRDAAASYVQELYQDRQQQAERNRSGFNYRTF